MGIDLGTTNTAVKRLSAQTLPNAEGHELTPSCVLAVPKKGLIVGRPALDLQKQYPAETVLSVKRLMGRDFSDAQVQRLISGGRYGYSIVADPHETE